MNRRFTFVPLVSLLFCGASLVRTAVDSSGRVSAEEKNEPANISIKKKWEFSRPDHWTTATTGIISPNGQLYFRSGVLLDLRTGKELQSRKELRSVIFDDSNEAILSFVSAPDGPHQAGMIKLTGERVLPFWEANGEVLQAHPASLTRLVVITRKSETLPSELVVLGKRGEITRIPSWPEDSSHGVIRVSPDRKTLALVDIPHAKIEIRSLDNGALLKTANAPWSMINEVNRRHINGLYDIAISPDLELLAFRHPTERTQRFKSPPGRIEIVKLASGDRVKELAADFSARQLVFLDKSRFLMSCRGAVQMWDLNTGENLVGKAFRKESLPNELDGFIEEICDLAALIGKRRVAFTQIRQAIPTSDGKYLALIELPQQTGEEMLLRKKIDRFKIHIMTVPSFTIIRTENVRGKPPFHLQFSSDSHLLVGERGKTTTVWEISAN